MNDMRFSPGSFQNGPDEVHWEGKGNGDIVLWTKFESKAIIWMDKVEARKALNQLQLLVEMAEADGL